MCGACWLACSDCGACVGGGVEIVYNLYTFFGVGGGVVVSLQKISYGSAKIASELASLLSPCIIFAPEI